MAAKARGYTFGLRAMVAESLAVSGLALSRAAPAGIVVAVWGRLYAPPVLGRLYRGVIDIPAGIPSVVYGFWGLLVIVSAINLQRPRPPLRRPVSRAAARSSS